MTCVIIIHGHILLWGWVNKQLFNEPLGFTTWIQINTFCSLLGPMLQNYIISPKKEKKITNPLISASKAWYNICKAGKSCFLSIFGLHRVHYPFNQFIVHLGKIVLRINCLFQINVLHSGQGNLITSRNNTQYWKSLTFFTEKTCANVWW